MIDPAKTYRTRDGREVRIYAVDGGKSAPVHGAVKGIDSDWIHRSWNEEGGYFTMEQNELDLIEVKSRQVWWANVYPDSVLSHRTREQADHCATQGRRIACVRVEFEEGEGL